MEGGGGFEGNTKKKYGKKFLVYDSRQQNSVWF
jgi:hypothetical protein